MVKSALAAVLTLVMAVGVFADQLPSPSHGKILPDVGGQYPYYVDASGLHIFYDSSWHDWTWIGGGGCYIDGEGHSIWVEEDDADPPYEFGFDSNYPGFDDGGNVDQQ
jgi:hypothetical protein